MKLEAVWYALSRTLIPTITVIILALMWSLSPTKTFEFFTSNTTGAGIMRILLMIAEIAWFYYLYQKKSITLLAFESSLEDENYISGNQYDFRDYLSNKTSTNLGVNNTMHWKQLKHKYFLVKID